MADRHRGGDPRAAVPTPAEPEKKKKKRIRFKSRRDTWREKTPKEKARERTAKAEAEAQVKAKADGDGDAVKATTGKETLTTGEETPTSSKTETGEETPDIASDDRASCSSEEDDPLSSPSNRLLLRTTAAAALASLARTQRLFDEDDDSTRFDKKASRAWTPPDANRAAGLCATPLVAEALEAWYVARGGDAAGMPTRDEIEEAREGARRGFAASRGGGDDADPEASARRLDVERWWMRRWRRGLLAHAHLEVEAKDRSGDVSARGGFGAGRAASRWPPGSGPADPSLARDA